MNLDVSLNYLILLYALTLFYCIYVLISTKINVRNIRKDYLTESVIKEIKQQNLEHITQIENRLNAKSMIYIDKNFNRLNERIKRLIKDQKT